MKRARKRKEWEPKFHDMISGSNGQLVWDARPNKNGTKTVYVRLANAQPEEGQQPSKKVITMTTAEMKKAAGY